jgi:hypothetical protein
MPVTERARLAEPGRAVTRVMFHDHVLFLDQGVAGRLGVGRSAAPSPPHRGFGHRFAVIKVGLNRRAC